MRLLARAVVGRQVEALCGKALDALQASEVQRAEALYAEALALDPNNPQAQVRLLRFYLNNEEPNKALAFARAHGGMIDAPALSRAPAIDGDPCEPVWQEAYRTEQFYITTSRWVPRPAVGRTEARIAHHDGNLYVAVLGYEDDLGKLVCDHTGRDADVWRDDCVELLFDPAITGRDVYQIAINSCGAVFDHLNNDQRKNFAFRHAAAVFHDRGYWACEVAIPGDGLGAFSAAPGQTWAMNVYRARIGPGAEHCAMWPAFGGSLRTDVFPVVRFAEPNAPT
jgi:hypothetical protein